ncbi:MAG: paraslipin [Bacteroidetes bacterium QH_1_61_8]|nr:MAG: paraslipin [Bacteroidetes bacterium QH_1_61_8]
MWTLLLFLLALVAFIFYNTFVIVEMREEVILERFGKYHATLEPGLHFTIPLVDRVAYRQETREQVLDGLVYLKVMDSYKASYGINDYRLAAVNLAQTTMRSEVGKITLDDTFSERDAMNEAIVQELDKASDPWGVKVMRYELKDIQPAQDIVRTMEKQMEAEREKRAEITESSGERDARINVSEGQREARVNEAEGEAREMELIAEATANGIERIADAIAQPGGSLAVKMRLTEQFIDRLGEIVDGANVSVLPMEAANIKSIFEGASEVTGPVRQS